MQYLINPEKIKKKTTERDFGRSDAHVLPVVGHPDRVARAGRLDGGHGDREGLEDLEEAVERLLLAVRLKSESTLSINGAVLKQTKEFVARKVRVSQ